MWLERIGDVLRLSGKAAAYVATHSEQHMWSSFLLLYCLLSQKTYKTLGRNTLATTRILSPGTRSAVPSMLITSLYQYIFAVLFDKGTFSPHIICIS